MFKNRTMFIVMKKPGEDWRLWGNKEFSSEQEAIEYLKANIAHPLSNLEIRIVDTIAVYGMKFFVEKDEHPLCLQKD